MCKLLLSCLLLSFLTLVWSGDMMRKSIIFDKKTPNVFYCPQSKPKGIDKLYVHARPLSRLCEFDGKPPPKSHKPDCYQDVDETEYACKEKLRIMYLSGARTPNWPPRHRTPHLGLPFWACIRIRRGCRDETRLNPPGALDAEEMKKIEDGKRTVKKVIKKRKRLPENAKH